MRNKNKLSRYSLLFRLMALSCFLVYLPKTEAQNTVKGTVNYTAVNKKIKVKRGSNYRNRGKNIKKTETRDEIKTKAIHSVISIVPLGTEIVLNTKHTMLRQKNKSFEPHVVAISKGSTVTFTNEDDFYHNVFSLSKGSRFNIGRKKPGIEVQKTFKKPGLIKVFCDIHPNMNAYILCLDTPFFSKVDEDGNYQIVGIPDGKYKLQFFNPGVEIEDQILELSGGRIIERNFNISPDRSSAFIQYDERWYAGACCTGTLCSHKAGE